MIRFESGVDHLYHHLSKKQELGVIRGLLIIMEPCSIIQLDTGRVNNCLGRGSYKTRCCEK